jgi:2-polyprenyl-3-methyl-5-hydroxy-6-metoxy-1,4-benzoquinol methylase
MTAVQRRDSSDHHSTPVVGDAFGHALLSQLTGLPTSIVYERDDGYVEIDPMNYLTDWSERDSWAVQRVKGWVLDIGAGGGRPSLVIVERGLDVVALDVSKGAVGVCRRRGLQNVIHGTVEAVPVGETFDSFVVLGNNLGLVASREGAERFYGTLAGLSRPGAVIVGGCLDPYQTDNEDHLR